MEPMKIVRFLGGSCIYILYMICTGPPVNAIGLNDQPSPRYETNTQFKVFCYSFCSLMYTYTNPFLENDRHKIAIFGLYEILRGYRYTRYEAN